MAAWVGDMGGAGLAKRLGTLLSGLLECGAFCGIIFGWASLVFVLKDLGYFEGLCQPSATPSPNLTLGSGMDPHLSLWSLTLDPAVLMPCAVPCPHRACAYVFAVCNVLMPCSIPCPHPLQAHVPTAHDSSIVMSVVSPHSWCSLHLC